MRPSPNPTRRRRFSGGAQQAAALLIALLAPLLTLASAAPAGQILVGPGDKWQTLAGRAAPGDEIILMPGEHRWAMLENLRGTGDKPIVIRGLTRDRPAVITAEHEGMRLIGVQHVVIKDVSITGARINGITVQPPTDYDAGEPWPVSVRLEGVHIGRIGPTGQRHGVQAINVSRLRIVDCTFEGWGGTAVDLVGCRDVEIAASSFTGLPEFGQRSAVHIRGGSQNVRVMDCTMTDSGSFCVEIGGDGAVQLEGGQLPAGRSAPPSDEGPYLATGVRVYRCIMRGSACPIHFFSARECTVRNVTFFRPRQWVFAVDFATADVRLRPSEDIAFESNLVLWEPGDLKALAGKGPRFQQRGLSIGENLWWSGQTAAEIEALGPLPVAPAFPQVHDVDPELDADLKPMSHAAELFGAHAP